MPSSDGDTNGGMYDDSSGGAQLGGLREVCCSTQDGNDGGIPGTYRVPSRSLVQVYVSLIVVFLCLVGILVSSTVGW